MHHKLQRLGHVSLFFFSKQYTLSSIQYISLVLSDVVAAIVVVDSYLLIDADY